MRSQLHALDAQIADRDAYLKHRFPVPGQPGADLHLVDPPDWTGP
ncbi:hypothetical protein ACFYPT_42045 [Streptomyces sp. NPDC005529]